MYSQPQTAAGYIPDIFSNTTAIHTQALKLVPDNKERVIEILVNDGKSAIQVLLPIIAWHTSTDDQRWVTWITPEYMPRTVLEEYAIDLSMLRVLHTHTGSSRRLMLTSAQNGTSKIVVISTHEEWSDAEREQLSRYAQHGDCLVLLVHEARH